MTFFRKKGHVVKESASLIPHNDPTLLFTGAGMNQFKKEFLGLGDTSLKRATTCQKCFRTSDIEEVGKTGRHHTFFEMLGNFSFGDYFKEEAIIWAWEYVREILKIPEEALWITIFKDDEESYKIWREKVGVAEERIIPLGEDTNFWDMGPTGPCGPCSEIIVDRGKEYGCSQPDCGVECECDRYLELWNLVFTQFDRQEDGKLLPLPQRNIDTGMGLERVCCILQNVEDNFLTDLFLPIIRNLEEISNKKFKENIYPFRVIADHVRGMSFLINDGVLPSNMGRGYVLRRLIRRALALGRRLEIPLPFLYKLVPSVIQVMEKPYPDLHIRKEHIVQVIHTEENVFSKTLEEGIEVLEDLIEQSKREGKKIFPGKALFRLYDTYGFPPELAEELVKGENLEPDSRGFEEEMEKQRERARSAWKKERKEISTEQEIYTSLSEKVKTIEFIGYEMLQGKSKILFLLREGKEVDKLKQGEEGEVILSPTPFYAESGGQVGDTGWVRGKGGSAEVRNSYYRNNLRISYLYCKEGYLEKGEEVWAEVDKERRERIAVHHTTTHLLQYALREILGTHVCQAGSWVGDKFFRFDFTHFRALHPEELKSVEKLINQKIRENASVEVKHLSLEEARKEGAIALFGEKYGKTVRMIKIGDYSRELCGGTHISYTGKIGLFLILNESSVGTGMRRIEGIAGDVAYARVVKDREMISRLREFLKVPAEEIEKKIKEMADELRELNKEKEKWKRKEVLSQVKEVLSHPQKVGDTELYLLKLSSGSKDTMREAIDYLKNKVKEKGVFLVAVQGKDGIRLTMGITSDLVEKGLHAGNLLRETARVLGGGGGGRPDMAEAGGKNPGKFKESIETLKNILLQTG